MDALDFICKISPETRTNCQIFIDDFDYETEHIISTTSEIEKIDIEPEIIENQVKMKIKILTVDYRKQHDYYIRYHNNNFKDPNSLTKLTLRGCFSLIRNYKGPVIIKSLNDDLKINLDKDFPKQKDRIDFLKDAYYKHLDRFVYTIKECGIGSLEKRREIILENS